ncbi:MAG: YbbR-like domain-containing protein [Oscillospiraceae bacterium]|jgi:YbbR domain-containing protein
MKKHKLNIGNFRFKKINMKQLFDNDRFVMVFSVFVAIFCWIVVVITISPTTPLSIRDVPVQISLRSERLQEMGLSLIGEIDERVEVMVEGPRSVVGNIKPEDLNITVSLAKVTEANTYDLELVPFTTPTDYTILSIRPSVVRVRLDQVMSKTLNVDLMTRGLAVAAGYQLGTEQVSPTAVRVTGPASELEKVARCVASVELSQPLSNTYAATIPVKLLDAQGMELDAEELHLTLDMENVNVWIPVLRTKELPLRVNFTNVPRGFPESTLREYMSLSNTSILVAGPIQSMDNYKEIVVDIDLRSLTPSNSSFQFDVTLPSEQFTNVNNISTILVEFNTESWNTATFHNISNIIPVNQPSDFEITLLTGSLPVTFVGDAAVLEEMSPGDIVVELDFSQKELTSGQVSYPVKISAPTKGMVWAAGNDYTVVIQARQIEETSE